MTVLYIWGVRYPPCLMPVHAGYVVDTTPSPAELLCAVHATCCPQVGGEVARRARGLGMKVIAYDPYASAEKAAAVGVTLVSFDEALAQGDFFSLHMPLTPGTLQW